MTGSHMRYVSIYVLTLHRSGLAQVFAGLSLESTQL